MPIINGLDRQQIRFSSLEDALCGDNDVRLINSFVDEFNHASKLGATTEGSK